MKVIKYRVRDRYGKTSYRTTPVPEGINALEYFRMLRKRTKKISRAHLGFVSSYEMPDPEPFSPET